MGTNERRHSESPRIIPGVSILGVTNWNLLQNRIALLGVVLVLLLFLFPPWDATAPNGITGSIGHYLVFSSSPAQDYKYPSVDYGRLLLETFGLAIMSGVAVFLTRGAPGGSDT